MRDFDRTILSQFASSPTLVQLITNINSYIDPDANLEAFYENIWNIDTAVGYGLDVWGRIVGIGRVLEVPTGGYFGFAEATNLSANPFGQAPFYSGQPTTSNFTLTDEAYRLLILAKAAANITDCSIPAINQILLALFPGRGNAYVTDGNNSISIGPYFGFQEAFAQGFNQAPFGDFADLPALPGNMTMVYTFAFPLQPYEVSIVFSGVLPKPVGVLATATYVHT
jgi:hypothetical protein